MLRQTHSIRLGANEDGFDALVDLALNLPVVISAITPLATSVSPIYASSGYAPANDYRRLGAILGPSFSPCPGSSSRAGRRSAPGTDTGPTGEHRE
jgi:hypothetical protein